MMTDLLGFLVGLESSANGMGHLGPALRWGPSGGGGQLGSTSSAVIFVIAFRAYRASCGIDTGGSGGSVWLENASPESENSN